MESALLSACSPVSSTQRDSAVGAEEGAEWMGSGWLWACRSQGKLGAGQAVFLGNLALP